MSVKIGPHPPSRSYLPPGAILALAKLIVTWPSYRRCFAYGPHCRFRVCTWTGPNKHHAYATLGYTRTTCRIKRLHTTLPCCLIPTCIQSCRRPSPSTSKNTHLHATQPNASRRRCRDATWRRQYLILGLPAISALTPHDKRVRQPKCALSSPPVWINTLKLFESSLTFLPRKVCEFESFQSSQLHMNVASH